MQIYEVGGSVRDEVMGLQNKDYDFTVVIPELIGRPADVGFLAMLDYLHAEGFSVFLQTPTCLTIRSKFPKGHKHAGMVADFVLARKEEYELGNRHPIVTVGTLEDDIMRRDFTVNALAKDSDGTIIDMVGGIRDIRNKLLRTPLPAMQAFTDDPLRALRAVRFAITKGFNLDSDIWDAFCNTTLVELTKATVSAERIREELQKAFKHDTIGTLTMLYDIPTMLVNYWLSAGGMWLKPTFKK